MPKYVKKPIPIEAVQWTGEERREFDEFFTEEEHKDLEIGPRAGTYDAQDEEDGMALYILFIHAPEGTATAQPGDWVLRGVRGELYPVERSVFEETYELAEQD